MEIGWFLPVIALVFTCGARTALTQAPSEPDNSAILQRIAQHLQKKTSLLPNLSLEWHQKNIVGETARVKFVHDSGRYRYEVYSKKGGPEQMWRMAAYDGTSYWYWDSISNDLRISRDLEENYMRLCFDSLFQYNPLFLDRKFLEVKPSGKFVLPNLNSFDHIATYALKPIQKIKAEGDRVLITVRDERHLLNELELDINYNPLSVKQFNAGMQFSEIQCKTWHNVGGFSFPLEYLYKSTLKKSFEAAGMKWEGDITKYKDEEFIQIDAGTIKLLSEPLKSDYFRIPKTIAKRVKDLDLKTVIGK
jgi:hypothetical protein